MSDYLTNEEFLNRERKLQELTAFLDPYPADWPIQQTIQELIVSTGHTVQATSEEAEVGHSPSTRVAGRIILIRPMGKNCFLHLQEESSRLQLMFNRDHSLFEGVPDGESSIKFLEKKLDLGDWVGVEGHLFRTHRGELTLYVKKLTLLSKSLLPLPDKHSGVQDKETRYRKRWLDMISHKEVFDTFVKRSQLLSWTRQFFNDLGFLEVETPILQNFYGGADADPFVTHLNALDKQQMFLRISLEPSLKKLLVGGHLKVFEMGKVFRNEGIDKTHNPEFTLLEAYAAFWDYKKMMELVENLFETLAMRLHGTTKLLCPHPKTGEMIEVEFKAPWKALTMKEALKTYANIEVDAIDEKAMRQLLKQTALPEEEYKEAPRGILIALLFEEFVEQHLLQPHHIYDHPIETTPLCKLHRDPMLRQEKMVERFESFILAGEICNAYSELNDPLLQRTLLQAQSRKEGIALDEEFLEAIAQGMPPAGGIGIGIDRMVMLLTGQLSIRDVLYFPLMKPQL